MWAYVALIFYGYDSQQLVLLIMLRQQSQTEDNIFINMLIVMLGATPGIVSHHSNVLSTCPTWRFCKVGKKHTHYIPSRGRERKLMKKQISVQMCSFDMRNRNRSLCAERIKTWAVSWLGLCTPIGVWNDLHLHKVHAQTHTCTRSEQHAVLLHKFTTQLGLGKKKKIIT